MCAECDWAPECYACMVGVATGPESHAPCCVARNVPMPVQDGQWGPEWTAYDRQVAVAKHEAEQRWATEGGLANDPIWGDA